MERVEDRVLLATFTVINTTDTAAAGSLRWAIGQSNAAAGPNLINFSIPGSGVQSIAITSALPALTTPVTIDATTQTGYTTTPLVELNGAGAGAMVDGLDISAGASTVKGLAINRFTAEGIKLSILGGDTITQDFLGTDPTGTIAEGNTLDGLLILANSNNNVVQGNLISGNLINGIFLNGSVFAVDASRTSGNLVAGNKIGTDVTGTLRLGNASDGLYVQNATNTTIGGTTPAARNIISGNGNGLELYDNSDDSIIEGNYIGTDVTGEVSLGNSFLGSFFKDDIVLRGISNSTIGGTAAGAGNVISGGSNYGIDSFVIGSGNLAIQGNLIGTDATGTRPLPNTNSGIDISGESNVTIGGSVAGAGNVISGNGDDGITTFANGAGLTIQGNFIGTDITGTLPLGNGGDGINATYPGITIGGNRPEQGNIIANNGATATFDHDGVRVTGLDTPVLSNSIYNSKNLGIELDGGNNGQAAPVLTSAVSMNTSSTIVGTLTAAAGVYTLQFFSTPGLNVSGHAEGENLLSTAIITVVGTTDNFSLVLPSGFTPGSLITATATDSFGNTSEFSMPTTGTGMGNGVGAPTISVTASAPTITVGQDVTDTFTITNPFTVGDAGIVLNDPLPAGTTFVSGMSSTGAPVTITGGVITSAIGRLGSGASVTVTVVLMATGAAAPSFTNIGSVSSRTPPVTPGTIKASVTTNVTASADLSVAIIAPTDSIQVGQDLKYMVTVTNAGPSDATGVSLIDTLPSGVTFISANTSSGPAAVLSNGVLTDSYGDLASGASFTLTILVAAGVDAPPLATDTASVVANEPDPASQNNNASTSTVVTPLADVAVTILPSADLIGVGSTLTYVVTVVNFGPSDASGVILNDILPGLATFVSATTSSGPAPTESGGTVTDAIGALPSGDSVTVTITIVATTTPSITDQANVVSNEPDSNLTNNMTSAVTTVLPEADLAINSATLSPLPVIEGQSVNLTFLVANDGPSTATGVILTDSLPDGFVFVSGTADGGAVTASGGVVTAPVGTLAVGSTSLVTIVAMATKAGLSSNSAVVSSSVTDPMPLNNDSLIPVQVTAVADVSVALSGPAGPLYAGSLLTYTATVTNNGPSTATNVQFTDSLPPDATIVSIEFDNILGTLVNGLATESLGTLTAGESATVVVQVIDSQPGFVVNMARVSAVEPDPIPFNNTAVVTTDLIPAVSLITFAAPIFTTTETSGSATITLNRTGDLAGNVSVHFSTVGGPAGLGIDYLPVSAIVNFPAGATRETINVPVLANPNDNHDEYVALQIDTPTGVAVLGGGPNGGGPANAFLRIVDTDPLLVGPTVTDLKLIGPVNSITSIEVDLGGNLDPATASFALNYTITALGGVKGGIAFGRFVPVVLASYNASTGAVTLTPNAPLPANELFLVTVNGTHPGAVSDRAGNPLNSVLGSVPGRDFNMIVARGTNLNFKDDNNAPVSLKLAGPGTIDLDQYPDGEILRLQVVGGVGGKTVLSGTARPTSGRTTIGSILGLNQFGSIRVKLTTPPFYVTNTVYPNLQTLVGSPAVDTLLPPPPPTPRPTTRSRIKAKSVDVATPAAEVAVTSSKGHHPRGVAAHPRRGR